MKLLLLVLAFAATAGQKKPENGYMGHYGYVLSYPAGFTVQPSFQGPIEVVQLMPPSSCSPTGQKECAKAGWINVSVFPKRFLFDANKVKSFSEYMAAALEESHANGDKPVMSASAAGAIAGKKFALRSPRGPFNRMFYFEGKKCIYRFAFDSGNKHAQGVVAGLAEVSPHDDPPR